VSVCELHKPLGNLREKSFWEIWNSDEAKQMRKSVARKECHCTTEVFLWSSIVYQPAQLAKAMISAKAWEKSKPLSPDEKVDVRFQDTPTQAQAVPASPISLQEPVESA
jgi:hypothetical protein